MPRTTLLDFFEDVSRIDAPYLIHDDGYRVRHATYREVGSAARAFAVTLAARGVGPDARVLIWSENRIEWLAALWGCLLARVALVPVDFHASADLVRRLAAIVDARAVLVGREVAVPADLPVPVWSLTDVVQIPAGDGPTPDRPPIAASTLAEIIFTSGATADPKGVTITHRNVLANILPIEREVRKYRRWARPFHPIRFLNLLPLSHMFGQAMAAFIPPMIDGTVVFSHGYSPSEVLRQVKSRRVSVLVCVPKVLEVLREYVERELPLTREDDPLEGRHWLWRWWRYRAAHRRFGWKFWCVVVGAAPLDPGLEAFWRKLGFLVVQGYGLTETAPVVTLNHPFRASRGTVGRPMEGVEVRIAADGEVLVRGDNVTTGYFQAEGAAPVESPFEDGWFHTGDIGEIDETGRLRIKGRKKEMIVTAQGLNVFPEDVERALLAQPGVVDAGVVGVRHEGEERVHAVLVVASDADVPAIVRATNASLEDHQRVWHTSVWPGDRLPRTDGTEKLKRRELQRWVADAGTGAPARTAGTSVADVVARFTAGRDVAADTTLDEIGLSSLDRVELLMALEESFHVTLDEAVLAETETVGDLERLVRAPVSEPGTGETPGTDAPAPAGRPSEIPFPAWNRTRLSWLVRRASLPTWILPLARVFMRLTVDGREHLEALEGPAIFAANHQSHMDAPAIFIALPARWRYRLAPAMSKEFFAAHFNPGAHGTKTWFLNSLNYYLACQFFNAFPLPTREAGTRQTLRYIGDVAADGYSVLIFPEGRRSDIGVGPFRPGVGMIASRLGLPVVPVRLEGLDRVLHPTWKFPSRGPVRVAFGPPIRAEGDDFAALAARIQSAVEGLAGGGGSC